MRVRPICVALWTITIVASEKAEASSNGITIESVNSYSVCFGAGSDLPYSNTDASNFVSGMMSNTTYAWTTRHNYSDGFVYDTDFYDAEATGFSYNHDAYNFDDASNQSISYFSGHGSCPPYPTPYVDCYSKSECDSWASYYGVPSGFKNPAVCRRDPGYYHGWCTWSWPIVAVTCGSGVNDKHGHVVELGTLNHSPEVRLGESVNSGTWAGAGTNGGTNLFVFNISCGALPDQSRFTILNLPAMAGAHLYATDAVVNGDTISIPDRGSKFAAKYALNPNGSVAQAWLDSILSITEGSTCDGPGGTYGGYGGFSGCAGHLVMGMNATATQANWQLNTEGWGGLQLDTNDATNWTWYGSRLQCNYDCNTWTWSL